MEAKTAELVRTHTLPKGEEDWGRRLMTQGIAGTDLPTYLLDSGPHNGPLLSRSDSAPGYGLASGMTWRGAISSSRLEIRRTYAHTPR